MSNFSNYSRKEIKEELKGDSADRGGPKTKGVWVIFSYDVNAYPIAVFDNEIEALRISNGFGYTYVKFWKFDQLWDDLHRDKSKNNEKMEAN